jgi:8-oxo-dGTP diphosphatase
MEPVRPKVGIGVLVFKDGKILLGKRKGAHGEGEYAGPGGHLEFGETFEECATREVKEETGIEIENVRVISLSNLLLWEGKHYVDIGVMADWKSVEPQVLEPERCESWDWYDPLSLPKPLMGNVERYYINAIKEGKMYLGTIR